MALPVTPPLSIKDAVSSAASIEREVEGSIGGSAYALMANAQANSDPEVGSVLLVTMLDFLGHQQGGWGRLYGDYDDADAGVVFRDPATATHWHIPSTETLIYEPTFDDTDFKVYKNDTPEGWVIGDTKRVKVYKRAKQTTDTWVLDTANGGGDGIIAPYVTADSSALIICDFTTYDYKFLLEDNSI